MLKFTLLVSFALLFYSCSSTVDSDEIQNRNGLAYRINSEKPFSGTVEHKFSSGQVYAKIEYTDGLPDGEYLRYHSNGQLESQMTFKEGKSVGNVSIWKRNGEIEVEIDADSPDFTAIKYTSLIGWDQVNMKADEMIKERNFLFYGNEEILLKFALQVLTKSHLFYERWITVVKRGVNIYYFLKPNDDFDDSELFKAAGYVATPYVGYVQIGYLLYGWEKAEEYKNFIENHLSKVGWIQKDDSKWSNGDREANIDVSDDKNPKVVMATFSINN